MLRRDQGPVGTLGFGESDSNEFDTASAHAFARELDVSIRVTARGIEVGADLAQANVVLVAAPAADVTVVRSLDPILQDRLELTSD